MDINLWDRVTAAVRDRYGRSALAQYGAGLGCDCGDCPVAPADVDVPAQRRQADDDRASVPSSH